MPDATMSVSERQTQTLKALTETFRSLNDRKVNVEAELKQARKNEEALITDAKKRFGLDNPEDLRAEFARRTEANEKMLSEYRASLTEIQTNLESLAGSE
jgi:transcriptional accessory protein Tex/SPT6